MEVNREEIIVKIYHKNYAEKRMRWVCKDCNSIIKSKRNACECAAHEREGK